MKKSKNSFNFPAKSLSVNIFISFWREFFIFFRLIVAPIIAAVDKETKAKIDAAQNRLIVLQAYANSQIGLERRIYESALHDFCRILEIVQIYPPVDMSKDCL